TLKCERKYMLTKTVNRPHRTRTPSTASDVDYVSTSTARGSFPISASGSGSEDAMGRVTRDGSVVGIGATGCAVVGPDRRSCGKRRRINSTVSVTDSVDGGDWSLAQGELTSASFSSSATTAGQLIEGYRSAFLDDTTGEVYEGGWCNGLRHGYGVAVFVDGTMYEGSWVNGREHGQGQWMSSNRQQVLYKGEWADGRMHGSGTFNFPNGDMYTGEWKEGSRHGRGEYLLADGTRYYGEWKDNLRHGKGTLTWVDGSVYEGEYDRGYRHGRGELRLSNGFYYSGSWDMDYMDGRGVSIFSDGQQYQGMFRRGLRDGRGSVTFSEGAVYEGRFRDDVIDGQGTIKISQRVPGPVEGEFMIPLEMQSDIRRIHYRAGFGGGDH
ncbi:PIP5K6, partial [Symbiodinium microadriaticum]